MKTQQQILDRIFDIKESDVFGFELSILFDYLTVESMESLRGRVLKDDVDLSDHVPKTTDADTIKAEMRDYMEFAWRKANGFRGLSAGRSIQHYQAWLWLLGENELANDIGDYRYYGKDELVEICDYLGLDASKWDDGVRRNYE